MSPEKILMPSMPNAVLQKIDAAIQTSVRWETIQREVKVIADEFVQLQQQWSNPRFIGIDKAQSIYTYYPYLFLPVFPSLTPKDVRPLAVAGRLFASSLFVADDILDSSAAQKSLGARMMRTQASQFEAYRILHALFPPTAVFWGRFRDYLIEFSNAYLLEQSFAGKGRSWREFSADTAATIAAGKTGIANNVIAGLVELAQDESQFKPLTESIEQYYVARQMFDDLADWQRDLQTQIPSLLLCRVVEEHPFERGEKVTEEYITQTYRAIFHGGHARFVLDKAQQALQRASTLLAEFPDLLWHQILQEMQERYEALSEDLEKIVEQDMQRERAQPKIQLELPSAADPWKHVALQSLAFIFKQWKLGFGELCHIMRFPQAMGHTAKGEYQHGDTFQRAIIADILYDVNALVASQLDPMIAYEADYLLSRQCSDSTGGWRYFPDLPELPPDADDLAQIMQVFLKCGRMDWLADHCETPLSVLLRDNVHDDGSFETWIIPNASRSSDQERQVAWAKNAWGIGPDCEVMANLLYALALYDADRFQHTIEKGVDFIEAAQADDGSWISTWYHGPFYGIYVCLRLLTKTRPNSPAIRAGVEFLRRTQHSDGGWGLDETSDALSTALALLGLATTRGVTDERARAQAALGYLTASMDGENSWHGAALIRMDTGSRIVSYGSRTITTAYVLHAATVWHGIVESGRSKGLTD